MNRGLLLLGFVSCFVIPTLALADGIGDGGLGEASDGRASIRASALSERELSKKDGLSGERYEKASPAQQQIAAGHFARTRSLLVAALNEFDAGVAKADPSSLIDAGMFREGIKARARDLERLLDPQARESESGVKYSADTRLLKVK